MLSVLLWVFHFGVIFSILFHLIMFARWLLNSIKKLIVWTFINKVSHITLHPAQKRFRRELVMTGFSKGCYFRSAPVYHYRYQTFFDGTYRKIVVRFTSNIKIQVIAKEEGLLYKKLTCSV